MFGFGLFALFFLSFFMVKIKIAFPSTNGSITLEDTNVDIKWADV